MLSSVLRCRRIARGALFGLKFGAPCVYSEFYRSKTPLRYTDRMFKTQLHNTFIERAGESGAALLGENRAALGDGGEARSGGEALRESEAAACNDAPIGVFDSGFGGLTVACEIAGKLPCESIVYVGDSARCPYGPRTLAEVDGFVQQIGSWLVERGVKMVVIACNTATAAGLAHAQRTFPVPVIGVVEPGARAAAHATRNRRVGVIATKATVESGAYTDAIRHIDAGITVFSTAAPRFVEIAEQGVRMAEGPIESYTSLASKVYVRPEFQEIAREYLEPLRRCDIDTLVLGCTHYPLLKALIGSVVGHGVALVSSAREVALDVAEILGRRQELASSDHVANYEFYTTGSDIDEFRKFGSRVFQTPMETVVHIDLADREKDGI